MSFVLSVLGGFFAGVLAEMIGILVVAVYSWIVFKMLSEDYFDKHLAVLIVGAALIHFLAIAHMSHVFAISGWQFIWFIAGLFAGVVGTVGYFVIKCGSEPDDRYNSLG